MPEPLQYSAAGTRTDNSCLRVASAHNARRIIVPPAVCVDNDTTTGRLPFSDSDEPPSISPQSGIGVADTGVNVVTNDPLTVLPSCVGYCPAPRNSSWVGYTAQRTTRPSDLGPTGESLYSRPALEPVPHHFRTAIAATMPSDRLWDDHDVDH